MILLCSIRHWLAFLYCQFTGMPNSNLLFGGILLIFKSTTCWQVSSPIDFPGVLSKLECSSFNLSTIFLNWNRHKDYYVHDLRNWNIILLLWDYKIKNNSAYKPKTGVIMNGRIFCCSVRLGHWTRGGWWITRWKGSFGQSIVLILIVKGCVNAKTFRNDK